MDEKKQELKKIKVLNKPIHTRNDGGSGLFDDIDPDVCAPTRD